MRQKLSATILQAPSRPLIKFRQYSSSIISPSLGAGGNIVVSFSSLVIKKSGTADAHFYIYEAGGYGSWDAYVLNDGSTWVKATSVFSDLNPTAATTIRGSIIGYDVDVIDSTEDTFRYVKIVDTRLTSSFAAPGSDIDAIVLTSAKSLGTEIFVDTDSRNGKVYNLYQIDGSANETGHFGA
ncbi:hypothetical protein [Brenneria roseae]|uniref:hypothetical protein n=1 Tax=Brenneria roseae TaxID=1509241 RepID=UPI001475B56E|nr:hypothetical protein [Brenneria roseae]